jgi:hypothetical protein
MSDGEYYSIHDKMRDLVTGEQKKVIEQPKVNEVDDIRRSLKYILDKLTNMDRFIRSSQFRYGHKIMDGEAYEKEVIKKYLLDMKAGKYQESDLLLLTQDNFKEKE